MRDTVYELNLLKNLRGGYAVHSPQGTEIFDEDTHSDALNYLLKSEDRFISRVILAEQCNRTCWLPVPNGWFV